VVRLLDQVVALAHPGSRLTVRAQPGCTHANVAGMLVAWKSCTCARSNFAQNDETVARTVALTVERRSTIARSGTMALTSTAQG
jgi:hypothetical protein